MKKIFTLFIFLSAIQLNAQEPADALRFSWYNSSGTARQQAIGGAMTSLGGDLSASFTNPAGLGFYKTSDLVLTPGFNFINNKATYYARTEQKKRYGFAFGTSGVVLGAGTNKKDRKLRGVAISVGINQTAHFGNNLLYRGMNNQSSYSQKFLEEIQDNNDKDANSVASNYPFGTSLAFNTYWIDTIAGGSSGNYQFQTRSPIATGLIQENTVRNRGGISEIAIAGAMNYQDKFYMGAALGIPILYYTKEGKFTEADLMGNTANNFDFASIEESLWTEGAGINLKAGVIYKPVERIRLGLAIHSPTWFSLIDRYNAFVTTHTETYKGLLTQSSDIFTNGEDAEFKYGLVTPYRIMGSASYVLRETEDVRKQKGFLTADIEYVNYKASFFTTDPESDNSQSTKTYLKSLNRAIDNAYKGAFNFKAGGELKFTTIMARLGAAYYGNPYKNIQGARGNKFQISGGLGYRHQGLFLDLAYVHMIGNDIHYPYRLRSGNFTGASIRQTGGNVLVTLGFKI